MHRSTKIMSTIKHDTGRGRFTTEVDGHCALLDYSLSGKVMTITHTEVPQPIGGRGVAAELMRAALAAAAQEGWSVVPACSYAAAYLRRRPDPGEVQHQEDLLDEALEESFPASDSPSMGGIT
jgi:predicted GNAT family acetyltransferase